MGRSPDGMGGNSHGKWQRYGCRRLNAVVPSGQYQTRPGGRLALRWRVCIATATGRADGVGHDGMRQRFDADRALATRQQWGAFWAGASRASVYRAGALSRRSRDHTSLPRPRRRSAVDLRPRHRGADDESRAPLVATRLDSSTWQAILIAEGDVASSSAAPCLYQRSHDNANVALPAVRTPEEACRTLVEAGARPALRTM